jgi:hypothetical protein
MKGIASLPELDSGRGWADPRHLTIYTLGLRCWNRQYTPRENLSRGRVGILSFLNSIFIIIFGTGVDLVII